MRQEHEARRPPPEKDAFFRLGDQATASGTTDTSERHDDVLHGLPARRRRRGGAVP